MGTIALFWLFFSRSERIVRHYEDSEDPMRAGRSGVISLMISVAGMVAVAVADERVIAHPVEHAGITTNLMLFGGSALYIAAQTWHGATLFDDLPWSRLLALPALVIAGTVTLRAPAYLAAVIAAAVVVGLVAFESRRPVDDVPARPVPSGHRPN